MRLHHLPPRILDCVDFWLDSYTPSFPGKDVFGEISHRDVFCGVIRGVCDNITYPELCGLREFTPGFEVVEAVWTEEELTEHVGVDGNPGFTLGAVDF